MDEIRARVMELAGTLAEAAAVIAAQLRRGERGSALSLLADWTEGMSEIARYAGPASGLSSMLSDLLDSLERGDLVGLADLMIYRVVPALDTWRIDLRSVEA